MIFLLALSMVALASAPQKHDVEVAVREKRILDPTLRGLTLIFYLTLKNTTSSPRFLAKYDYRFMIKQSGISCRAFRSLWTDPCGSSPKAGLLIALPVKITFEFLFRAMPDVQPKDRRFVF